MPKVAIRADYQAGVFVVVEGAKAYEVLAVAFQLNALSSYEVLEAHLPLEALNFGF